MPSSPSPNRKRVDRFKWKRDYFQGFTHLSRGRMKLSVLAIIVAGGWLALGWAQSDEVRHYRYTHGPVTNPHAAWDKNCQACHQSYSWKDIGEVFNVHARWHDFRCESCHHGPANDSKNYAPHHAAVWDHGKETDCGLCHHDHQGRDVSLVKVIDNDCTVCHKELKHPTRQPAYLTKIGSFEKGREDSHPEFRPLAAGQAVPRTLKFNHARHLQPGMVLDKDQTRAIWKVGNIDTKFQDRYRLPGQQLNDPVKLSCASCHQLDSERLAPNELLQMPEEERGPWEKSEQSRVKLTQHLPRESTLPPRAAGAYMLPINFDNHCQACHPLNSGPVALKNVELQLKSFSIPHRLQPSDLREVILGETSKQLVKATEKDFAVIDPKERGRLDARIMDQLKQLQSLSDVSKQLVAQAERQLACSKCHTVHRDVEKIREIERSSTPPIWFLHAKFNHASHRAMNCATCHTANYEAGERAQPEKLDLPGIDNCRQCHAPPYRVEVNGRNEPRGGVRHGCVDCHRYHNGDFSLQGLGSRRRDPPEDHRLTPVDFLRGLGPSPIRNHP